MFFFVASTGFLLGVGIYEWRNIDVAFITLLLVFSGVFLVCSLVEVRKRAILVSALFLVTLAGGMTRSAIVPADTRLDVVVGEEITLTAVVRDEPVHKERTQQLVVTTDEGTSILVITRPRPRFQYGDEVHISGALTRPESFITESGRLFNYPKYLAKDGIFYQTLFPDIDIVGRGRGDWTHRTLFSFKEKLLNTFDATIPQPHAALLGGLIVGAQESLGDTLLADFRTTGIIHIVVLSGYNVTIVAEAIRRFFVLFLPRLWAFSLGAIAIILFAILVGAGATIVRASIMALVALVGKYIGRTHNVSRVLLLAGTAMVMANPNILLFDPSFQLSFLATIGLIYVVPILERPLSFLPKILQLREFATTTIATQFFVLPLLLYQVGTLSLVALPVNMLVLAVIPMTMLVGFMAGIVGVLNIFLALPLAYISYGLLAYILNVVGFFARFPNASVTLPLVPTWAVLVLYSIYGLLLWYVYKYTTVPKDAVV